LGEEAHRNRWMNWDVGDIEAVDVLRCYLLDRAVLITPKVNMSASSFRDGVPLKAARTEDTKCIGII